MKNLRIGKKLILTFGIIIALFLTTVVVSVLSLNNTNSEFSDFYTNGYPVSNKTTDMRRATQMGLKCIALSMITSDVGETNSYIAEANEQLNGLQESFAFLQQNFRGDVAILDQAQSILNEAKPYRAQITELAAQNKNDEAAALLFNSYQPLMTQFQDLMTQADTATTRLADESYRASAQAERLAFFALVSIAAAALVFTLALSTYITRSLTRPIAEIEASATGMAQGNLDVTVEYHSRDELGVLSDHIRDLSGTLKRIIGDVDYLLGAMSQGNFNIHTMHEDAYVGHFHSILLSMRSINTNLSGTLTQINQSADQVASGSEQVSGGAQALSQGATEQASSVEELAATIGEISDQVEANAQSARRARGTVDEVGERLHESNRQMQEMTKAMDEISDASGEIGKIIKTIEDIAFQTNILALNAAVEAARAGAAGKGFAVVADEVRNLASKSSEASKSTSALIEGSLRAVQNGTRIADETAASLATVVEGTKEITAQITEIAEASDTQASSIAQVTQGIDQISSVVQTNSATAEESAAASEELSSQAQMLKSLVGRFQLKQSADSFAPVE